MTNGQHIPEEDLALYAMQALDPPENATVQAHLDTCVECRGRLAEAAGDVALIGMGVEQARLPEGARERFLNRIQTDGAAAGRPVALPVAAAPRESSGLRLEPRRRRLWPVLIPWAAAAAMVAVAGYLAVQNRHLRDTLDQDRTQMVQLSATASRAQELMDVLTARSAQRVTLTERKGTQTPTGHTSYLADRGALIFVADNLRPVPASKTYELWVIPANGGAPIPAGTFRPAENGTASVILPPLPTGVAAKAFGVTIENAEGSATPSLPIILSGSPGA